MVTPRCWLQGGDSKVVTPRCLETVSKKVFVSIVLLERQVLAFYIKMRVSSILILCAVICLCVIQNNRANANFFKRSPNPAGNRVERSPQNNGDTSTPQPTNGTDTTSDDDDDFDDQMLLVENWISRRLEYFS
ncbi:hypothetical protein TNCT_541211 [Trichonephila clavata]|uniref:Uncharacterized protein n=1 Tax=Trichonephila clavata TaxID=2740835 RepID=A0A8X6H4T3_TRICU|nr:hypothetical protein TNCT_541211 [Trichonephila clavata]